MGERMPFPEGVDKENLVRKLMGIRKAAKISQADLAKKMNISAGYVCNVEHYRTNLTMTYLNKFAELFGLNAKELLSESTDEYIYDQIDYELAELFGIFIATAPYEDKRALIRVLSAITAGCTRS